MQATLRPPLLFTRDDLSRGIGSVEKAAKNEGTLESCHGF